MHKLSVVIITYNEELNIGRCLASVNSIADDIVIIDSFSTDSTPELCKKNGVRFIQKAWEGYSAAKNFGNQQATYDWIFSIDADEALSGELIRSILMAKNSTSAPTEYKISRVANYCGKWIRHGGWYPDIKLRFFDRRKSHWEGVVHEKLTNVDESNAECLKGDCYHYTYYTIDEHRGRSVFYSAIAAKSMYDEGKRASLGKRFLSPASKFIQDYILKLGILDGYHGYMIAMISAKAAFDKYHELHKLSKHK